jgi:hypothetical protein
MSRWTPRWGGRVSRLDVIFLAVIAAVIVTIIGLLVL